MHNFKNAGLSKRFEVEEECKKVGGTGGQKAHAGPGGLRAAQAPQRGTGALPRWRSRGRSPLKQNECRVFPPAEIASPWSNFYMFSLF